MKRIYSFLFAILTLAATTGVFTSCQEDAPEIDYTINITVNNDFTEVVDAINNGTLKQEAAIAALTAAIEKMNGEQNEKMDAIVKAINDLAKTTDAKLAIIEAAMKAQTLALEAKLDLLTAAVKAQTLKQEEMGKLLATAIDNLGGTLEEKLAAIEAIIESTSATLAEKIAAVEAAMKAQTLALEAKLDLLEAAIKNIPDYSEALEELKEAIKTAPDYTTALEEIKKAIADADDNFATQLGLLITAIEELPDYSNKLTAIKDAIPSIPDYSDQITALETALEAIADRLGTGEETIADKLQALSDEIAKITAAVEAGNTSQDEALAQIIALLKSGALAGGGSGSGGEGSGGEGEGGEGSGGEGSGGEGSGDEPTGPYISFTTKKPVGSTIEFACYDSERTNISGVVDLQKSGSWVDGVPVYQGTLTSQEVKLYGIFTKFNCNGGALTKIDTDTQGALEVIQLYDNPDLKFNFEHNTNLRDIDLRGRILSILELSDLVEKLPLKLGAKCQVGYDGDAAYVFKEAAEAKGWDLIVY